jgi:hypothetical protein
MRQSHSFVDDDDDDERIDDDDDDVRCQRYVQHDALREDSGSQSRVTPDDDPREDPWKTVTSFS